METYEVAYQVDGETRTVLIEARTPVEASRLFMEKNTEEGATVLCVIRQ